MTETGQNFAFYEGSEPTLRFYVNEKDEEDNIVGVQDLTGMTASYKLGTSPIITKTATIVEPATEGVIDVELTAADLAGQGGSPGDYNRYAHELRVTDVLGKDSIVAVGTLTIRGSLHDEP